MTLDRRDLLVIVVATLLLRFGFMFGLRALHPMSFDQYAHLYDGDSYLITAEAMAGDGSKLAAFHGRVFPGYPAMIAAVHRLGVPSSITAVGIDWASAAAAAVMAAILFDDRRVGLAMTCLFPHYILNSSMALSEAPLLAIGLSALLLTRRAPVAAGGLAGFAALIRPMACFAFLGQWMCLWRPQRRWPALIAVTTAALVVQTIGWWLVGRWRGDALAGPRYYAMSSNAYGGHLLTWPFRSLVMVPLESPVPIGRVLYMWGHALFAVAACVLFVRRWWVDRGGLLDDRDSWAAPWAWGNTLFAVSVGSFWGFECFHRFLIPALPALFWATRKAFPRRIGWWLPIMIGSLVLAIAGVDHDFRSQ